MWNCCYNTKKKFRLTDDTDPYKARSMTYKEEIVANLQQLATANQCKERNGELGK